MASEESFTLHYTTPVKKSFLGRKCSKNVKITYALASSVFWPAGKKVTLPLSSDTFNILFFFFSPPRQSRNCFSSLKAILFNRNQTHPNRVRKHPRMMRACSPALRTGLPNSGEPPDGFRSLQPRADHAGSPPLAPRTAHASTVQPRLPPPPRLRSPMTCPAGGGARGRGGSRGRERRGVRGRQPG